MTKRVYIESYVEQPGWPNGVKAAYCKMPSKQPLLLSKEAGGVRVADLLNSPVGMLCERDTPKVISLIEQGYVLLARIAGECQCFRRACIIWSDGKEERKTETGQEVSDVIRRNARQTEKA